MELSKVLQASRRRELIFDERRTKSEGVLGIVWRGREWTFLHCTVIALSLDLSLCMTVHFTGHNARVALGIPISMAVVYMKLCDNRSETSE